MGIKIWRHNEKFIPTSAIVSRCILRSIARNTAKSTAVFSLFHYTRQRWKKYKLLRFSKVTKVGWMVFDKKLNVTRILSRPPFCHINFFFCFFSEWIFAPDRFQSPLEGDNVALVKNHFPKLQPVDEHPRLGLGLRKIAPTDVYLLHIRLRMSSRLVGR